MSKPGDYCRAHSDTVEHRKANPAEVLFDCSGQGRPSCRATECLWGAEPCPGGNHWKAEGIQCARTDCGFKLEEDKDA